MLEEKEIIKMKKVFSLMICILVLINVGFCSKVENSKNIVIVDGIKAKVDYTLDDRKYLLNVFGKNIKCSYVYKDNDKEYITHIFKDKTSITFKFEKEK